MLATLRPVLQWGEGGEAAPGGRRLRALPWSTAVVWGVAIVVALTVATPEPALAALALLPTAAVPGGMLIDVCRLHRRVRADAAELEAELGLLREAQQLTRRLTSLTEQLAASGVQHGGRSRPRTLTLVPRHPR
jgi:hypothetical protein